MSFHFPLLIYARGSPGNCPVRTDTRLKGNGKVLRRTEDITFLSMPPDGSTALGLKDYIHEAQVSGLVTGIDEFVWTAYCFVETYFRDSTYDGLDTTQDYDSHAKQSRNMVDPLCAGRRSSKYPIWKPREYFTLMLKSWASRAKDEWENTVSAILERTEPYVCMHAAKTLSPEFTLTAWSRYTITKYTIATPQFWRRTLTALKRSYSGRQQRLEY